MKIFFLGFLFIFCTQKGMSEEPKISEEYPVVILGGGVGALTSALYLSRAGFTPLVISGPVPGGAITFSSRIQNWPGEKEISGIELAEKIQRQAQDNGSIILPENVLKVDFSKRPFVITTKSPFDEKIREIKAKNCIVALGSMPNFLGVPGESIYFSRGVYSCATCDGGFYKDKAVVVVGGGDSALTEAQYLANIASKVTLVVRRESLQATDLQRKMEILSHPKIRVLYSTIIEDILGNGQKVSQVRVKDLPTGANYEFAVDAVFLAIGSKPTTDLFQGQLELDANGYILLKKGLQTSKDGVYAVGDVCDPEFKQAITAAADGAKAALQLQKNFPDSLHTSKDNKMSPTTAVSSVLSIASEMAFQKELKETSSVMFVFFYTSHCMPCKRFSLLYESWASSYSQKIKFCKVDCHKLGEIAKKYQIQTVPTLVILDKEQRVLWKGVSVNDHKIINALLEREKDNPVLDKKIFNIGQI